MNKRNGIIDFLRFVFCILIIFWHGRNLGGTPEIALFAEAGYIPVEFFFLVSGFLMAQSVSRLQDAPCTHLGMETVQFIWRKIKPILAYYVFAVVFSYSQIVLQREYTLLEALKNLMLGVWDLLFLRAAGIGTYGLTSGTWYLSAMFLSMLILYPMLRKWKEKFIYIIAPLIAIFGLGYLSRTYGHLDQYVDEWELVYSGIPRALAEISLGCVCWAVCEKLRAVQFTTLSRVLITLVQVFGYAGVLYCVDNMPAKLFDFVMLLCLAVCVTLSFSGQGIAVSLFQGRIFPWLGKMSMIIYLNHYWVKNTIAWLLPKALGYWKLTGIYVVCVFLVSLLCLLWGWILRAFWDRCGTKIKSWFWKEARL